MVKKKQKALKKKAFQKKALKITGMVLFVLFVTAALVVNAFLLKKISGLKQELEQAREAQAVLQSQISELSETSAESDRKPETEENGETTGKEPAGEETTGEETTGETESKASWKIDTAKAGSLVSKTQLANVKTADCFKSYAIKGEVLKRINGKSYVENPDISLSQLRYLKVLHYNFSHKVQVGELIVNAELAEDYLEIFEELYENEYEIQSMYLIDDFWTGEGQSSDHDSMQANNTSAFCYRTITGGGSLSNHALGRAIDINPQQNPYVTYANGTPTWYNDNADDYIDRNKKQDHMISHEDICYQIFTAHGFTWGGDWDDPKDYQHFEK